MPIRFSALLAGLALLITGPALAEAPLKVISLAPHLTELAYTAGSGETLVGVVEWSHWPPQARDLPRIGNAYRFDLEVILGLDPDLALFWQSGTPEALADRLEALGIEVLRIETQSLEQIGLALEQIGRRLGSPESANAAADTYRERLAAIRSKRTDAVDISIFYQVAASPLYTLGGRHVITEVFAACGARNLFGDLNTEAAAIDREAVIVGQPDLILVANDQAGEDPLAVWRSTQMVRLGQTRVESVDPVLLIQPTPRIVEGIERVCALVDEVATVKAPKARTGE